MRINSVFGSATVSLSLPSLTIWRGASTSFAADLGLARSGRHLARFVEIVVFAVLLALMALPAPARAQTFTISSVTASPATVQPGQTVTFSATISASQNASNYPVEFSLVFNGQNVTQKVFYLTFKADAVSVQAYSWTVPAGTGAGTYNMEVAVFNPTWSSVLAMKSAALTIAAATVGSGAAGATTYPVLRGFPVISGTAQVGKVLTSTTGTWTNATSFTYQWSGNNAWIPGATAATYIPVASDVGHTLTSTVVATGSPGAKSSATSAATVPIVAATPNSPPVTASRSVPFVALHTYYMSPTGSDSNNGLTAATAWATPNHSVSCGDVIVAAAGSYSGHGLGAFGTVSNCPSTSGGIDGKGGVYFATLLCGGADLTSCNLTFSGTGWAIDVTKNNWAVEGFQVHGNSGTGALVADGSAKTVHHIAFINNVVYNVGIGIGALDDGVHHDVPGATGFDYVAFVGNITQNAEQNTICTAATVMAGPASIDKVAGTHFLMYGGFSYNQPNNRCGSDVENFMFDTWDAHGVTNQTVMMNNVGWSAYRFGIQIFIQNFNSVAGLHDYIYNNTVYNNNLIGSSGFGDINIQMDNSTAPIITAYNNIGVSSQSGDCGLLVGGRYGPNSLANVILGTTGNQNVAYNMANPSNSKCLYNGAALGANFLVNPTFNNTSDLLANRSGPPSCAGFINVTACMGWNANSQTLKNPSVIYDLTPSSTYAAKGYQNPSVTCTANALYPTWLKGIIYLNWNGTSLTENADLVTKPCGL